MITYQQEFMVKIKPELESLIGLHWEEIALNQDNIKLNPDWDKYYTLEEAGVIKAFTARDDGILVGYFIVTVSTSLHYMDHLFAINDVIFIKEEYRKSGTGSGLIKFAESCLKEDGVSVLFINTKDHKPFDKLLESMNYNYIERNYSKWLG